MRSTILTCDLHSNCKTAGCSSMEGTANKKEGFQKEFSSDVFKNQSRKMGRKCSIACGLQGELDYIPWRMSFT